MNSGRMSPDNLWLNEVGASSRKVCLSSLSSEVSYDGITTSWRKSYALRKGGMCSSGVSFCLALSGWRCMRTFLIVYCGCSRLEKSWRTWARLRDTL